MATCPRACRSLAAPIFPLMIYKSAKCACSPDGAQLRGPSLVAMQMHRGGTSLHGHRCPGLSEERSGDVAMGDATQAGPGTPPASGDGFPGQPRQRLCRLRGGGDGEGGGAPGKCLCAPRQGWLQRAQATQPPESTV